MTAEMKTFPLTDARPADLALLVAEIGALPQAALAMPKQRLEHERGFLRRLLRLSPVGTARTEG
ncbi:MAG: hypothetical protein QM656_06615 [Paracoccaceae bacterium]